jgi:hypothetical protein
VEGRDIFYFVNNHSDSTKKFSETEIINMLEFFIENTRNRSRYESELSVFVVSFISSSMGLMRSTKSPNLELLSERTSSIAYGENIYQLIPYSRACGSY